MQTTITIARTTIALARSAADAAKRASDTNATDAHRDAAKAEHASYTDKLVSDCTKRGYAIADVIARASVADPVKRQPKLAPQPEAAKPTASADKPKAAAKPAKPAKPSATDTKRSADHAERVKLIGELQLIVAATYNGPSLAVRSNPKRINASVYADLFAAPKHRTDLARVSTRDVSALALIIQRGDKSGAFDPVALNLDSGIFSRLRSVGFIELAPASAKLPYRVSKPGAEHARVTLKRAA